jgi:hypothetical protein
LSSTSTGRERINNRKRIVGKNMNNKKQRVQGQDKRENRGGREETNKQSRREKKGKKRG